MKERPILFSAPMVRAILDGSKTQTRRVVKLPVEYSSRWSGGWHIVGKAATIAVDMFNQLRGKPLGVDPTVCPYGQPGDRLWVRETFGYVSPDEYSRPREECNIEYRADLPPGCTDRPGNWPESEAAGDPEAPRWRPSIHMPRAASRILLEIVSVRVERLNDISAADSYSEGIDQCLGLGSSAEIIDLARRMGTFTDETLRYATLWESINGVGSWDANPWVWVVEFKRVDAKPLKT